MIDITTMTFYTSLLILIPYTFNVRKSSLSCPLSYYSLIVIVDEM